MIVVSVVSVVAVRVRAVFGRARCPSLRSPRSQLIRVPEVLTVLSGKKIDPASEWPFFIGLDFESLDKKRIFEADPIYIKFQQTVIKPNVSDFWAMDYEMEPGRPIKYS